VRLFLVGAVNKVHTAPWPHCPNRNVFNDRRNSLYVSVSVFQVHAMEGCSIVRAQ